MYLTFSVFHSDISGNTVKDLHPLNMPLIFITFLVSQLDIFGNIFISVLFKFIFLISSLCVLSSCSISFFISEFDSISLDNFSTVKVLLFFMNILLFFTCFKMILLSDKSSNMS